MKTYGDIFALWQFVLSWLLQVQPTPVQVMKVHLSFADLARAMVTDTGIQDFHAMDSIKDRPIGPATVQKLKEIRPLLSNIYPFFGDKIEMIVNPTGMIEPE